MGILCLCPCARDDLVIWALARKSSATNSITARGTKFLGAKKAPRLFTTQKSTVLDSTVHSGLEDVWLIDKYRQEVQGLLVLFKQPYMGKWDSSSTGLGASNSLDAYVNLPAQIIIVTMNGNALLNASPFVCTQRTNYHHCIWKKSP